MATPKLELENVTYHFKDKYEVEYQAVFTREGEQTRVDVFIDDRLVDTQWTDWNRPSVKTAQNAIIFYIERYRR